MMNLKSILILAFIAISAKITAQKEEAYHAKYDWTETPEKIQFNPADTSADQTLLFEKTSTEYRLEGDFSVQYNLHHTRTLVKTDRAIESNNKVYIFNGPGDEVLIQKARVIKPNGSFTTLKKDDIKESYDEDGNVELRYFALDGLEKGSVIEYVQYIKRPARYTGSTMIVQGSSDVLKGEYEILAPNHLDFRVHSVNGLEEFALDTLEKDVRRKYLNVTDLKGLKDEYGCPYNSLLQKCYYKLDRNLESQKRDFYSYNNVAKIIFDNMFAAPSKSSLKKIKAILKDMDQNGGTTLEDKMRYLEFKVKSEYHVVEANIEQLDNLDYLLENKVGSESAVTQLFLNLLREAKVNFEFVLTSDREESPFEKDYEAYNFLNDYLIYINDLDKYWSPDLISRIGFPPAQNTYNKGLFIQEKTLNDLKVPIAKVKDIKITKADESMDIITATVDFTKNLTDPEIYVEREVTGYKALYPHSILDYLDEDKQKEVKKDMIQYIDESSKLEDITYKNDKSSLAGKSSLAVRAKFTNGPFVSTAGETILLKAGMLIGPQAELYNKEKRTLPLLADHTRKYERKIEVTLPEGYHIKNPEVLVMNDASADKTTGFSSEYKLEGDKLIVTIHEYYEKVYYDVNEYAEYERIMNAAADFNKVVLIIEKG